MNDKKLRIRKYLDQFEPGHCLVAREAARALGITVTEVVACLRMALALEELENQPYIDDD